MSTSGKILVVSGIYAPDIGGPATYIPQICHYLVKNGFEVSLVSLEGTRESKRNFEPWKRSFILRNTTKLRRILSTIWLLLKESSGCKAVFSNGLFEEVALLKIMRPKIYCVAKIVGDPVWERNRNSTASSVGIEDFNQGKLSIKNLLQRYALTWSLNQFNEITCPSTQLAKIIKGWGVHVPITVIQNGIRCHEIVNVNKQYDVVSVSRLVPWKNLDKLILACSRNNLSLAICGEGPEMSKLEMIANEFKARVEFLGMMDEKRVMEVLNKSNVFALISSYEGLSFALLEAMMAGKRILVSSCEGNTDVVQHGVTGIVVNANEQRALDISLLDLVKNDPLGTKLALNAHVEAKANYCADKQLSLMLNLITGSLKK